jgi:fucose 4-O-acetylase-like acetyltransferase
MKKTITHIEWIDIAKGIAILCVIAGHLGDININHIVYGFHLTVFSY